MQCKHLTVTAVIISYFRSRLYSGVHRSHSITLVLNVNTCAGWPCLLDMPSNGTCVPLLIHLSRLFDFMDLSLLVFFCSALVVEAFCKSIVVKCLTERGLYMLRVVCFAIKSFWKGKLDSNSRVFPKLFFHKNECCNNNPWFDNIIVELCIYISGISMDSILFYLICLNYAVWMCPSHILVKKIFIFESRVLFAKCDFCLVDKYRELEFSFNR